MVVFRGNMILQLWKTAFYWHIPFLQSYCGWLLWLSLIRSGQPFTCRSGVLRFPGRSVTSLGLHGPGVLMLLCVVAPVVLGSPDIGEDRGSEGSQVGWAWGRSGFWCLCISTCTRELTVAAVGRKGELENGHWGSHTGYGLLRVLTVFKVSHETLKCIPMRPMRMYICL